MTDHRSVTYSACKLCNRQDLVPIYELFDTHPVSVVRCRGCGFQFQNPVAAETAARYRDETTSSTNLDRHWTMQEKVFRRRLAWIRKHAPGLHRLEGRRVLDVGAGAGVFLRVCKEAGAHVLGIEWGVARAMRDQYGIEIMERDLADPWWVETHSGGFDLITLFDVLEHVYRPRDLLQNTVHLLAPGGALFISTPVRDSFIEHLGHALYRMSGGRIRHLLNARYNRHHVQIFSSGELLSLLRENGLDVSRIAVKADYGCATWLYIYKFALRNKKLARLLGAFMDPVFRLVSPTNKAFVLARRPTG